MASMVLGPELDLTPWGIADALGCSEYMPLPCWAFPTALGPRNDGAGEESTLSLPQESKMDGHFYLPCRIRWWNGPYLVIYIFLSYSATTLSCDERTQLHPPPPPSSYFSSKYLSAFPSLHNCHRQWDRRSYWLSSIAVIVVVIVFPPFIGNNGSPPSPSPSQSLFPSPFPSPSPSPPKSTSPYAVVVGIFFPPLTLLTIAKEASHSITIGFADGICRIGCVLFSIVMERWLTHERLLFAETEQLPLGRNVHYEM